METTPIAAGPLEAPVRGGAVKKPTAKQRRMRNAVAWLTEYMRGYDKQPYFMDYSDETFIDDVLYGLGVALHGADVAYASGFEKWRERLKKHLGQAPNDQGNGPRQAQLAEGPR